MFAEWTPLVVLAMATLGVGPADSSAVSQGDARVEAAVRSAIETRLGRQVEVTLQDFVWALTSDEPDRLVATPDPLGRTGRPLRFVIATARIGPRGHAVRLGEATAIVHVSGEFVRARRSMPAGRTLVADDLEVVTGSMEGVALRRVPSLPELIGARLTRGLAAGDPIMANAVAIAPAVRAGDRVRVTVRRGGVEATAMAVAEQTAGLDRIIRVINPSSRRAFRARVIAAGEVEVVDEW